MKSTHPSIQDLQNDRLSWGEQVWSEYDQTTTQFSVPWGCRVFTPQAWWAALWLHCHNLKFLCGCQMQWCLSSTGSPNLQSNHLDYHEGNRCETISNNLLGCFQWSTVTKRVTCDVTKADKSQRFKLLRPKRKRLYEIDLYELWWQNGVCLQGRNF